MYYTLVNELPVRHSEKPRHANASVPQNFPEEMPRPPRAHQLTQKGEASRVSTEAQRSLPEHDTTLFTSLKVKPAAVFHLILLSKRKPLWILSFEALWTMM